MPDLDPSGPHRANASRRWNPAVRQHDYTYRGQGFDLYEDGPDPACTCTWAWGPPTFRWERIGAKEDCPCEDRHVADVAAMQRALDQVWDTLDAEGWRL